MMSNTELYHERLNELSIRIMGGIKNRMAPLDKLNDALTQLSQTNAIKGNAADAMKAYISEVHMTLNQTLELILFNYEIALVKYVNGYLDEVDSDENFQLVKEDLDAHERNLSSRRCDFTSFGNKLKAISDEAEDIISLGGAGSKSVFHVVDEMEDMKRTVSDLKDKWNHYEEKDPGFGNVQNLIAQTISLLNSTLSVPRGYSYSPGSFRGLISKNFVDAFQVNTKYAQENQKALKAGVDRICKNYKVDQDRMAKEAKREGLIGLIWDYVQVQAGAVIAAVGLGLAPFSGGTSLSLTVLGGSMVVGGINSAINHGSMALTGKGYNLIGNLTNGALQWYNKNIGSPLVKTGNPIAKFVAGFGNGSIEMVGGMGQFSIYDTGKTIYTLYKDPQARAQFEAKLGNWWNKVRSGDAYTIGQAAPMVLSVIVAPDDIGAAASKASKAESLLGKAGTFSKSMVISSAENVKNIVTLPGRLLYNIGNKAVDLGEIFSKGKGLVGDFTKSVVVSSAKNAKSLISLPGRALDDVKKAAGFVNEKLVPASEKAVKDFGKVLQNTGEDLKGLIRQEEVVTDKGFGFSVGNNIKFSDVVSDFKSGVNDVKDNFVKAIKSGDKVEGNADKLEIVIKDGERYIDGKPVKINQGQQDKHIVGTNNYNQAVNAGQQKSILTGDADKLLDEFAGTGTKVSEYKERVDFGQVIGKFYDIKTGLYEETTMGMITYGKNGAHIIPSNPNVY